MLDLAREAAPRPTLVRARKIQGQRRPRGNRRDDPRVRLDSSDRGAGAGAGGERCFARGKDGTAAATSGS